MEKVVCQSSINLTFNQHVVRFDCCHKSNFPLAMTSKMSMTSQWLIRTAFSISNKIYLTTSPLSKGCKVLFSLVLVLKKNIPSLPWEVCHVSSSSNYVRKYLSSSSMLKNFQGLSTACKASVEIIAVFQFFGTVRQWMAFKISHELSSLIITVSTSEGFSRINSAFSVGYL